MGAHTSIVIVGATGDLARRKLIPSLFRLWRKNRLPESTHVVGFARSPLDDDGFRDLALRGAKELAGVEASPDDWRSFASLLRYVSGDATKAEDYAALGDTLVDLEQGADGANRLFYLSVAPELYGPVLQNVGGSGLAREEGGWRRVVIEKPFGHDLLSAQALNRIVHHCFDEHQVFRIDHYLGKETVQNLMVLRFANTIFEPVWSRHYIDHVQITAAESVTVAGRGAYYDQSGVVRDMVQNHLLQLLTIVAMEPPIATDPESLRSRKVDVLRGIRRWEPNEVARHTVKGRYRGYLDEKGVPADSQTATYVAMRLHVDNWRWEGVPFYLRTGKALADKTTEIVVQFKEPPSVIAALGDCQNVAPNLLAICVQPDEGVHLRFEAKEPDHGVCMRSVDMEFHYRDAFGEQAIPEAYEALLEDAIKGDARLFIRNDHIEEAWRIVDPILAAWRQGEGPLCEYAPGSWGPEEADAFLAVDGRAWHLACGAAHGPTTPLKAVA